LSGDCPTYTSHRIVSRVSAGSYHPYPAGPVSALGTGIAELDVSGYCGQERERTGNLRRIPGKPDYLNWATGQLTNQIWLPYRNDVRFLIDGRGDAGNVLELAIEVDIIFIKYVVYVQKRM